MSVPEQISLFEYMIIASKGTAGVTDNAVATLLIGRWTGESDLDQERATLRGDRPFDELSLEPEAHDASAEEKESVGT